MGCENAALETCQGTGIGLALENVKRYGTEMPLNEYPMECSLVHDPSSGGVDQYCIGGHAS